MKHSLLNKIIVIGCFTGFSMFGMPNPLIAQKGTGIEESLQEFFIGETVYAQEKNEIQFTVKPSWWKTENLQTISIPLQIEYGITDRLQVEFGLPYFFLHPKKEQWMKGAGNAEVGFLYNILKGNGPFALSLGMDIGLPTAKKEKDIDESTIEWEPSLIVARQIGRSQVHLSFGVEITKDESTPHYNLATVFPFGDWRATLELNGEYNAEKSVYVTPGLIWKGLDDFEFGLGASKNLRGNNGAWGLIFMITYEFSLTKSK